VKKRCDGNLGILSGYEGARSFAILERFGCIGLQGNRSLRGTGFRWLVAAATAKVVGFEGRSKLRCSYRECW
jgi:hypothetical protein